MKQLVQDFTQQLKDAKEIASKAVLSKADNVQNIVITGLGGSGHWRDDHFRISSRQLHGTNRR